MRRALDLFANVRPVKIPREGVDWCFFRENTEDFYVDTVNSNRLVEDAIKGMFNELDPHTVYISVEEQKVSEGTG